MKVIRESAAYICSDTALASEIQMEMAGREFAVFGRLSKLQHGVLAVQLLVERDRYYAL